MSAWISKKGDNSYLIPAMGKVAHKIQQLLDKEARQNSAYIMHLYEEEGTYNFWLKTSEGDISSLTLEEEARKLSREELEEAYAKGPSGQP